ncbi:hypothetical protein HYT55_03345 [Candidatus Woesearchaeota archaeon]|nr:hypothetical protein [Candidatus Woesearchaeota archaeon]
MIRKVMVGALLGYNILACGPTTENNYYGITPSGRDGSFSCADAGEVERLCKLDLTGRDDKFADNSWTDCVAKGCEYYHFSQACIDCMVASECVDQPKESGMPETPWELCAAQGQCPKQPKEWAFDVCY